MTARERPMDVGPGLDDLVAMWVMRWTLSPAEGALKTNPYTHWLAVPDRCGATTVAREHWMPSVRISDALLVVERMRDSAWEVEITNDHPVNPWHVRFRTPDKGGYCGTHMHLPAAICFAALFAIEENKGKP